MHNHPWNPSCRRSPPHAPLAGVPAASLGQYAPQSLKTSAKAAEDAAVPFRAGDDQHIKFVIGQRERGRFQFPLRIDLVDANSAEEGFGHGYVLEGGLEIVLPLLLRRRQQQRWQKLLLLLRGWLRLPPLAMILGVGSRGGRSEPTVPEARHGRAEHFSR